MNKAIAVIILNLAVLGTCSAKSYEYPYDAADERDPLRPLINERGQLLLQAEKSAGDLILQGILYSDRGSQVFINNELFKEGQIVEGYTIIEIKANIVILEKDSKCIELKWEVGQ